MRRRLLAVPVAAALVAGAAGGCAGPAPTPDPPGAQAMALTAVRVPLEASGAPGSPADPAVPQGPEPSHGSTTAPQPTPKPQSTLNPQTTPQPQPEPITAATFTARLTAAEAAVSGFTFTMTLNDPSGDALVLKGSLVTTAAGHDWAMAGVTPSGTLDFRVIGSKVYMAQGESADGKFLLFDPNAPEYAEAGMTGIDGMVGQPTGATSDAITMLSLVPPSVQLDGATVQRYDVTYDTSKVASPINDDGTPAPPTITYSFWLGSDDLPRKMRYTQGAYSAEVTYSGFGAPGPVVTPSADQILDLSAVASTWE
ncbi:hypothetical protein [Cellulomonas sp. URHD0024]|uniref:hypothetical protein n=1 Tax=Cellulomonas sp. URHD0024 TaxID=1302620 RepID=UPI0012DFCC57|nr:hypothetical protein [Cellulomonas sp. URHD0024]